MNKNNKTRVFVAFAVTVVIVVAWCLVLDTFASRRIAAWRISRAVDMVRVNPADHEPVKWLMQVAQKGEGFEATYAVVAIGDLGGAAAPAIPALIELLEAEDGYVSREAANTLAKLGPVSAPALEALVRKVQYGNAGDDATWFSAEAIGRIGVPAIKFIPLLKSKLGSGVSQYDYSLSEAIELLDGERNKQKPAAESANSK